MDFTHLSMDANQRVLRKQQEALMRNVLLCLIGMAWLWGTAAQADTPIAMVKTVQGEAFVERAGARAPLKPGAAIYRSDICETARRSTLGITFKDNMMVSVGPNTRLTVASFEFEPIEQKYGVLLQLARGSMQYVSGLIAKLSPESVQVATPVANITVRGTRFAVRVKAEGGK
jgi:hypothetical protein